MTLFDSSLPDSVVLGACDKAQIGDWVKERGLDYEIDNALSSLSGGEKQRILLARFFAHRARFGVLDEITAGLDMKTVAQVEIRMADELDGFVYVSHRLDSGIMQLVDQVIVVDGMRIVAAGSPEEVEPSVEPPAGFGPTTCWCIFPGLPWVEAYLLLIACLASRESTCGQLDHKFSLGD